MVAGMQIASMFARIGADLTGLNSGLRTADSKLGQFGSKLAKWGGRAAMAAGAALAAAGGMAVKEAAGFESAVNLMGVAASGSGTSLDSLREAALEVGEDTQLIGIDAMEAADAITVLLKSGMSATDVFGNLDGYLEGTSDLGGALRASVDLAAASNLEFAESADAISVALATFGRPATDATAIADNFVATADASIAEVRDLTEAFVNVGPTANQFGWRLEDVNTALALLSQRGIRGSEAGTALKSMMTNLMRDTPAVTGTLNRLNISLYDQEGQMRALPDIVAELEGALSGLSEEERNLAIQTLAGTYGMKAMSTLVTEGEAGWQEMEANIDDAASSQDIAEARTDGLAGAFEQLQGTIQTLLIEAGDPLIKNLLTPGVKWLTEFLGGFEDSGAIDIFAERVKKLGEYLFGREESWEYTPEFGLRYTPAQQGLFDQWAKEGSKSMFTTLLGDLVTWSGKAETETAFLNAGIAIGEFISGGIKAIFGEPEVGESLAVTLGHNLFKNIESLFGVALAGAIMPEAPLEEQRLFATDTGAWMRQKIEGTKVGGAIMGDKFSIPGLFSWATGEEISDLWKYGLPGAGLDMRLQLQPNIDAETWEARGEEAAEQFQRGWESVTRSTPSTSGILIDARAQGVR